MKIGVDLDDVVFEFVRGFLNYLKERHEMDFVEEDVVLHDLWKVFGIEKKESIKLVQRFYDDEAFDKLNLIEKSVEVIKKLAEKNEIYFVTSRDSRLRNRTEESLKKFFWDIEYELHFSNDFFESEEIKKTKAEICEELGVSHLVEDNLDYAQKCSEKGIKVFLYDKPWNKKEDLNEGVVRVKSWDEILEAIENEN